MGNSTGLQVRPKRKRRADGTYAEVLERRMRSRGLDVIAINHCRWWDLVTKGFQRWEEDVAQPCPDVLVLNYGLGECQPRIWPNWLIRYMSTWRTSSHPVAMFWRQWIVRNFFRGVVWVTPKITPRLGLRTFRVPPKRFTNDFRRLIQTTRWETGALVLVMNVNPPGPFLQRLMPGIEERAELYGDLVARIVSDIDDADVRLVDAASVVERLGWRKVMVDGLHYTPTGHEEIATMLEEHIGDWLGESDDG